MAALRVLRECVRCGQEFEDIRRSGAPRSYCDRCRRGLPTGVEADPWHRANVLKALVHGPTFALTHPTRGTVLDPSSPLPGDRTPTYWITDQELREHWHGWARDDESHRIEWDRTTWAYWRYTRRYGAARAEQEVARVLDWDDDE
jgi:hypothetical protein